MVDDGVIPLCDAAATGNRIPATGGKGARIDETGGRGDLAAKEGGGGLTEEVA